jgi:hypothetical protein
MSLGERAGVIKICGGFCRIAVTPAVCCLAGRGRASVLPPASRQPDGRAGSFARPSHAGSRGGCGLELLVDAFVQRYLPHVELVGEGVHGNHAVVAFEQVHEPADEIRVSGQCFSSW